MDFWGDDLLRKANHAAYLLICEDGVVGPTNNVIIRLGIPAAKIEYILFHLSMFPLKCLLSLAVIFCIWMRNVDGFNKDYCFRRRSPPNMPRNIPYTPLERWMDASEFEFVVNRRGWIRQLGSARSCFDIHGSEKWLYVRQLEPWSFSEFGKQVIIGHDVDSSSALNLHTVKTFLRMGYGVLTFDYPGYGRSYGTPKFVGASLMENALQTVIELASRDPMRSDFIFVYGEGISGSNVILESVSGNSAVDAVVAWRPHLDFVSPDITRIRRGIGFQNWWQRWMTGKERQDERLIDGFVKQLENVQDADLQIPTLILSGPTSSPHRVHLTDQRESYSPSLTPIPEEPENDLNPRLQVYKRAIEFYEEVLRARIESEGVQQP